MNQYPEVFRQYNKNYKHFEEVKEHFENEDPLVEQAEGPFDRTLPKDMSPWEKRYDNLMPEYTCTSCQ